MTTLTITRNKWSCTSTHPTVTAAELALNEVIFGRQWVRTVGDKNWLYERCASLDCDGFPHSDGSHSHRVGRYQIS